MKDKFDYIIIGSGIGGLECAYILAKEGHKVCVLEKNQQFGGCLQTFKSDGVIFDTGVHYVGGLDEGQSLHQYFKYFDIIDKLKYQRMDSEGFEHISFEGDAKIYKYGLGGQNFVDILAKDFPLERKNLEDYVKLMHEIGLNYPFYHLSDDEYTEQFNFDYVDVSIVDYLKENFQDDKLIQILAGTNLLYAGKVGRSTLYEHALIINAYIESSYRFIDGAGQIGNALVRNIRKLGGVVKRYQKVVVIEVEDNKAKCVRVESGERYTAPTFISNIHPVTTLNMLRGANIRKAYQNRLNNIPNSSSAYALHIVLKEDKVPYQNYNVYHFKDHDVWKGENYTEENWPLNYMAFTPISSNSSQWADSMIVIAYMNFDDVQAWSASENVVGFEENRGADYEAFKIRKSEKLLKEVYKRFPEIKGNVVSHCASTPLTYRDYLYSPKGSIYGYSKDYNNPLLSYISPRSKISNLLFTGQNINMHGVLGVTVSAFMTCGELLGKKYLYDKVKLKNNSDLE